MNRFKRTTLGILVTFLLTVPFAAQAASTCYWASYCSISSSSLVFGGISFN